MITLPEQQQPQSQQPIILPAPEEQTYPLAEDAANNRALKATAGVGPITGKYFGDMYQAITTGKEPEVRKEAAAKIDAQNEIQRQNAILHAARTDPSRIKDLATSGPKTDPSTVFEDKFAEAYGKPMLDMSNPWVHDSDLGTAMQEAPEAATAIQRVGQGIAAKREYFQTKVEDLQAEISQQSLPGWGADQLKMLFQPYNELKLRGNVSNTSFFNGLLGSSLADQAEKINE